MFQLRALTYIDNLQSQLADFFAKYSKVGKPVKHDAALFVEVNPALQIHNLIDTALKNTQVRLGSAVTERHFGIMMVQHSDQGEVKEAGRAILRANNLSENDRLKVEVLTDTIIRGVEKDHSILFDVVINNKIIPGESLFILETKPAAYVAIACNEALKAANVKLIEIIPCTSTGRLVLSGSEAEIDSAAEAARKVIQQLNGACSQLN